MIDLPSVLALAASRAVPPPLFFLLDGLIGATAPWGRSDAQDLKSAFLGSAPVWLCGGGSGPGAHLLACSGKKLSAAQFQRTCGGIEKSLGRRSDLGYQGPNKHWLQISDSMPDRTWLISSGRGKSARAPSSIARLTSSK